MSKIRITYIISNVNKAVGFEWIVEQLNPQKFQLSFLLLNPSISYFEEYLYSKGITFKRLTYRGKRDLPFTLFRIVKFFFYKRPEIIHCHLFDATLIGLIAGKITGIKKRIYTRHHSVFNWKYNLKGVKYDKFINWLATDIVAISKNVWGVLTRMEQVNPSKITLIHHGFDLEAFSNVDQKRIDNLKKNYNPRNQHPVIGVIARWIEWKGIQYIIPAFKKLRVVYPDALLIFANTNGPFKAKVLELLKALPKESYQLVEFENDLFTLYKLFDVYVHTPIDTEIEAFGQTYVEALAGGIPSIFTLSGIAREFISEANALIVPFENSEEIYIKLIRVLEDPSLRKQLITNGLKSISSFSIENYIGKLEQLYLN